MAKGQVKVEVFADRLRLRWSYFGKRYCLSVGLADTPINRKVADQKSQQIELDIISGKFDPSLAKYKLGGAAPMARVSEAPAKPKTFSGIFAQHWNLFVEHKQQSVDNPFTIIGMYRPIPKKLAAYGTPINNSSDARDFVVFMLSKASPTTVKKHVIILNNFGEWVKSQKLVAETWDNPFFGLTEMCRPLPPVKDLPFTVEEVKTIIEGFTKDPYYAHYTDYVRFLFMIGCRTSEAIGLRWKHISQDCGQVTFSESLVREGTGVSRMRKSTKTHRIRYFPCNAELQQLLRNIRPEDTYPEQLVFPSSTGKPIDATNFLNRA